MVSLLKFPLSLLLLLSDFSQGQYETENDDEDGRPWKNPLQELQSIAPECALRTPEFYDIVSREENKWQRCIDKITLAITEKFPVLESRNNVNEDDKVNSSVIHEIDMQLHMVICRDTTAYKSCWYGILQAMNKCDPGSGDISGKLYFSLYDDICRDGGRITVENRRKAALAGKLCERDYSTEECRRNSQNMNSKDLCMRFHSNAACDLSSVDSNCTNKIDKMLHADIFQRVEKVLHCPMSSTADHHLHSSTASFLPSRASSFLLFSSFMLLGFKEH